MAQKPSIPKGTRDFSPAEVSKRNYIMSIMRKHFENFGYQPIETPSFENSETLMGKYGEEGDRLIFKILNSGDYLKDVKEQLSNNHNLINRFYILLEGFKLKYDSREVQDYDDILENGLNTIFANDFLNKNQQNLLKSFFERNQQKIISGLSSDLVAFWVLRQELFLDFFKNIFIENQLNSNKSVSSISEKALRYDLTVPFARYVVQHQNDIEFPFKRYQIQPVWRADRPQKGRFREFFQCDADVVGSTSLWQEVELVQLYDAVFSDLGLNGVTIKINNRKILSGIAEVIGASDKLIDFTVALDKLDKIGEDGVKKEMLEKGISEIAIEKVQPLFNFTGKISEKIDKLSALLSSSIEGMKGVEELRFICDNISILGLQKANLDLDVTLARGLNYYTGAIFEVACPKEVAMGSIGGGGRYDDLTGIFGLKNMSGVGVSFGLDRIYLVLEELSLFPETVSNTTEVLFLNFGDKEALEVMKIITSLRKENIKSELYPDAAKLDKQFKHAERRGIKFVVKEIIGTSCVLKNLQSGEQNEVDVTQLVALLK